MTLMFDVETYAAAIAYVKAHGGGSGSSDYDDLSNQPQINGNTLSGNKTSENLGILTAEFSGDALVLS